MLCIDLFVSGRLCLFGEHSDWASEYRRIDKNMPKGYSLIVGTNQGIHARVKPLKEKLLITSTLPDGKIEGPCELEMNEKKLREKARCGDFFSYCAGVASYIQRNHQVDGLLIENYQMDLPIKKGLSSSAAICILTAQAFNTVYKLKLTRRGEMEIAYQGEIMTPSRCGRMDQACAYGSTPVLLTFHGDYMDVEPIYPKEPLYIVVVDLKKKKNTRKILSELNKHYSAIHSKISLDMQKALGKLNKSVVLRARKAIEAGDCHKIGELMKEAQTIFDKKILPACPSELTAPKLHKVLNYPGIQSFILGGKGVGSQGDGSAQFITRDSKEQSLLIERMERELDVSCLPLTIPRGKPVQVSQRQS